MDIRYVAKPKDSKGKYNRDMPPRIVIKGSHVELDKIAKKMAKICSELELNATREKTTTDDQYEILVSNRGQYDTFMFCWLAEN